jgi:hypothetical protein
MNTKQKDDAALISGIMIVGTIISFFVTLIWAHW